MQKFISLISLVFVTLSCATRITQPTDKGICYLLFDMKTKQYAELSNHSLCEYRIPAVSTFKIPLAIMAIDTGIIEDASTLQKWDGSIYTIPAWNKDHTADSWMKESVVWYSQNLTRKLGVKKITRYLNDFKYGNMDMSGGVNYAWLTPAPFINDPMENSLKISGYEQADFLYRLWKRDFRASAKAHRLTRELLTQDISPLGNILSGKTGSGFTTKGMKYRIGWFVGHLNTKTSQYIIVINFVDKHKQDEVTYGGKVAKDMAISKLKEKGLW